MEMEYPGRFDVELLDPFVDGSQPLLRWLVYRYNWLIKYMPRTYGAIFHGTDNRVMTRFAIRILGNQFRPGIRGKLTREQPAGVVSFHPLTNHLVVEAIEKLRLEVPFITVITDMSDFHRFWMSKKADVVVVPSPEARRYCVRKGLDARKVHVAGLPVDPRFTGPLHGAAKRELRERLGLEDKPTLLLVAGGEGAGRLAAQTKALDAAGLGLQLLVVCGRNERLQHRLAARSYQGSVRVFGFVDNMPELMQASDAVVTKAGPGTIAEALISGLPIFLTYYVPGQEGGNVHFVVEQGVGYYTRRVSRLVELVRRSFVEDRQEFERMQGHAEKVGRPGAAAEIADLIAAAVQPPVAIDEELL
jgi:1,2-diacylglycerol 3-beta-galactosyltransferase